MNDHRVPLKSVATAVTQFVDFRTISVYSPFVDELRLMKMSCLAEGNQSRNSDVMSPEHPRSCCSFFFCIYNEQLRKSNYRDQPAGPFFDAFLFPWMIRGESLFETLFHWGCLGGEGGWSRGDNNVLSFRIANLLKCCVRDTFSWEMSVSRLPVFWRRYLMSSFVSCNKFFWIFVTVSSGFSSGGSWEKKLPADWDESDTIDWLFTVANKLGIPCEYFASFGHLRG